MQTEDNADATLEPDAYDELVNDFHDKLATRVSAALEQLQALERELVEIQERLQRARLQADTLESLAKMAEMVHRSRPGEAVFEDQPPPAPDTPP